MQKMKKAIIGLVVLFLATLGAVLFAQSEPTAKTERESKASASAGKTANMQQLVSERISALGLRKVSRMERTQQELRREIEQLKNRGGDQKQACGTEQKDRPGMDLTPEERDSRVTAHFEAQVGLLDHQVVREPVDPTWSSASRRSLLAAFDTQTLGGIDAVDVDCRSTLCRVELALNDAEHGGRSIESAQHDLGWTAPSFVVVRPEDKRATVYLARDGHSLPQVELEGEAVQ